MSTYEYNKLDADLEKLQTELSATSCAAKIDSLSFNSESQQVIVNCSQELTASEQTEVQGVVASHDATVDQKSIDFEKYKKRAQVKDEIMATMASNNMERVRTGVWTVEDLVGLTQDTELKLILDDVNTLSFELAVQKVQAATNPLITESIKNEWVAMLAAHFYN